MGEMYIMLKVGVKFCGSCNPYIDMGYVYKNIQGILGVQYVSWESKNYDVLLIISGCPKNCITKPDFKGPAIIVAGNFIDMVTVSDEKLVEVLREKIERLSLMR